MKRNSNDVIRIFLASLVSVAMAVVLCFVAFPVTGAKAAESVYTLDGEGTDLNLSGITKKDPIPEGNYGTDGFFKLVGGNFRSNSDTLSIETAKKAGSSVQFTVTGIATLTAVISSNGGSSSSDVYLKKDDGTIIRAVGESDDLLVISGSTKTAFKYSDLEAGTYTFYSPDGFENSGRGFRIYSMTVTEYPAGERPERAAWSTVQPATIASAKQNGSVLEVTVNGNVGYNGADKMILSMLAEDGTVIAEESFVADGESFTTNFAPANSGNYYFSALLIRDGEADIEGVKSSAAAYVLPLSVPTIQSITNAGSGSAVIEWSEVKEATKYEVLIARPTDADFISAGTTTDTTIVVNDLVCDAENMFILVAYRDSERKEGPVTTKMIRDRIDRNWTFTWFGSSTGGGKNKMTQFNEDAFTFKLISCTIKDDGTVNEKGGKFTAFYDGISYFYTKIDAAKENFVLTATFVVDYINPVPDGQEGFGLVIRDSLGEYGVNNNNFETNSASIIATKFEATHDGTKYSMKDGLGVRFSYGLTKENIADGTMATYGVNKTTPCQYDSGNLINPGDEYTLTIKKTNTGYHCVYNGEEYILYGVDKLLQIDKDYVYVGFAVARGCNVSVKDVQFSTSDVATDAPAEPEPTPSFDINITPVSPNSNGSQDYTLRFKVNCDGTAYVTDVFGKKLSEEMAVKAGEVVETNIPIKVGTNNISINFTADKNYVNEIGEIPKTYYEVSKTHLIEVREYPNDVFYVAPGASATGAGTKEDPIDLGVAISFILPGQKIILMDGVYDMSYQFKIVKGNSGTAEGYKYMVADKGAHPVFDFKNSKTGGFVNWGNYWYMEGFDVCNTPDNVKGIQLAGSYNIVKNVNTYNNGDTGFQISGSSNDSKSEWPAYNQVINCTSHDNADSAMNNGDGFAAKLSVSDGNIFIGCISYNNIDDGWDLYAKVESGPIGVVTIDSCIAYNNGFLSNGKGYGDGNGFKLGGDGIAVEHVIKNSLSFGNYTAGITSNSNPAIKVYNCTSFGNGGAGVTLYGKGETVRNFALDGMLSMNNGADDNMEQSLSSKTNFLQSGKRTLNVDAEELKEAIFAVADVKKAPTRDKVGNIVFDGLFVITDANVPTTVGARIGKTTDDEPEVEITATPEPTATPEVTPTTPPTGAIGEEEKESNLTALWVILGIVCAAAVGCGVFFILKKKNN